MSTSLTRNETLVNSRRIGLLCGVMFLAPISFAAAAREPKTNKAQRDPAAASQAELNFLTRFRTFCNLTPLRPNKQNTRVGTLWQPQVGVVSC